MSPFKKMRFIPLIFLNVFLCFAALAEAIAPPSNSFTAQRLEAGDIESDPKPRGLDVLDSGIFENRGVVLQSSARFFYGDRQLNVSEVELKWLTENGQKQVCISYKGKCSTLKLPEEFIVRIAYWVATSKSTVAFTYLPQNRPEFSEARKKYIKMGYRIPTSEFRYPYNTPREGVLFSTTKPSSENGEIVHPDLDNERILSALAYIDFVDGSQNKPTTDIVLKPYEGQGRLISSLNGGNSGQVFLTSSSIDRSYTNADVHSRYAVDVKSGNFSGEPLRYFWTRFSDQPSPQFRRIWEFRPQPNVSKEPLSPLQQQHSEAISLTRLVSTLRAFQLERPADLATFINEGLDSLERK